MKHLPACCILASLLFATAIPTQAQDATDAPVATGDVRGNTAVGGVVQVRGRIKAVDAAARNVVVTAPDDQEWTFNLGEDVRNFDQIHVGDFVVLTYAKAVALELHKVENNGIRERSESEQVVRAPLGEKPAKAVQTTVRIVANVVAVDPQAQTVVLRGARRTVELAVEHPAMLDDIKVGNQVEAKFIEAIAIEVTAVAAE